MLFLSILLLPMKISVKTWFQRVDCVKHRIAPAIYIYIIVPIGMKLFPLNEVATNDQSSCQLAAESHRKKRNKKISHLLFQYDMSHCSPNFSDNSKLSSNKMFCYLECKNVIAHTTELKNSKLEDSRRSLIRYQITLI